MTLNQAIKQANQWHSQGQTIVLVTGVFDLLHIEHIKFLEKAKNTGDKLIVGLETDVRTRAIKGPDRPVNNQVVRLKQTAALKAVDLAFLLPQKFSNQKDWKQFIASIKPDIYAVSSHTSFIKNKRAIIKKFGGVLKVVHSHNPDFSTSLIIARLINPHLSQKPKTYTTKTKTGFGRGKLLGYPTLNLIIPQNFPYQHGIYAGWIWLGATKYQGAFHFGPIPTFNHAEPSLEVFLLNRNQNIPHTTVRLQLLHYLRPIKHFAAEQDLVHQITQDVTLTKILLGQDILKA